MKILVRHNHLKRLRKKSCCTTQVKGLKNNQCWLTTDARTHTYTVYEIVRAGCIYTDGICTHTGKSTSTVFTITYRMEDAALGAWWALVSSEASSGGSSERGSSGAEPQALQGDTTFEITYAVMQCSLIKNIFHFYRKGIEFADLRHHRRFEILSSI